MAERRLDWRTYQLISLRDLMSRGLRTPSGGPRVARMPCLPDAHVAIPKISFGQITIPDFPTQQRPADADWTASKFSIRDGDAYVLHNAVVQGELGIVTIDDFVIRDSIMHALPEHLHRFEWVGEHSLRLPPAASETRVGAAAHLLGGFVGNRNYAHWLTDVVPSVLVPPFHDTFVGTTLLWPKLRNSWQSETLELLPETGGRSKFLDHEEYVTCETLRIVPQIKWSGFSPHPHRMMLFDAMRARAGATAKPSRRIYVSRGDTEARRMLNEADVIRLVEANGFEKVTLTGMSVAEQIALFADATHIVAPHGAGLANVAFCNAGAVLCELHMDAYVQWAFRRLSGLPPLTYGCLVGRAVEHRGGVHTRTWRAPVDELERVLSARPFIIGSVAMPLPAVSVHPANIGASAPSPVSAAASTHRIRQNLVDKIWRGNDPFRGFPGQLYASDTQGWNSVHPYLSDTIDSVRPSIIVEVGVWKGGSVLTMASRLKELGLDAVVIAIDTWLGSWEHWYNNEAFGLLDVMNGRPEIYQKFMSNVVRAGLQGYIVPLPLDSINASHFLRLLGIRPDIVHIDGCHDYQAVTSDLSLWWPQMNDGGTLIGDDYYDNGVWPEVRKAIDDFLSNQPHQAFEFKGGKCRVRKA